MNTTQLLLLLSVVTLALVILVLAVVARNAIRSRRLAQDNARLYEQQRQQTERLATLNIVAGLLGQKLSLEETLNATITSCSLISEAMGFAIYLRDERAGWQLARHGGLSDGFLHRYQPQTSHAEASPDEQLAPYIVADLTQLPNLIRRETLLGENIHALLELPMQSKQRFFGLLMLAFSEESQLRDEQIDLLQTFATLAAQALINAQTFAQTNSAREQLSVRVAEQANQMRALLDAMEEGILLIDPAQEVALANPRIDLVGLQHDQLEGQNVAALLQAPTMDFSRALGFDSPAATQALLADAQHWASQATLHYEVGERYVQRQFLPVLDAQGQALGLLLVFYNKTEERALARARESLTQMIIHDLRSPLTAVTTSLQLMQELVPPEATYYPLVLKATEASRHAIRKVLLRIDGMLDVARLETGEQPLNRMPVSLTAIVEAVRSELGALAQEMEVALEVDIAADVPLINGDADKLERMVMNLMDNAIKYSPSESSVRVSVRPDAMRGYVRLAVADRGVGIPDEYKQRLFDRYVQIVGRQVVRRGVGLGLTFCKLVAEAHGGRIWIEDNPAGGSVFVVTLPTLH